MLKRASVCAQGASGAALHLPGPQVRHLPGPSHPAGPPHRQEHGGHGQLSPPTGLYLIISFIQCQEQFCRGPPGSYVEVPNSCSNGSVLEGSPSTTEALVETRQSWDL
jgi:hypothetical protein